MRGAQGQGLIIHHDLLFETDNKEPGQVHILEKQGKLFFKCGENRPVKLGRWGTGPCFLGKPLTCCQPLAAARGGREEGIWRAKAPTLSKVPRQKASEGAGHPKGTRKAWGSRVES